MVQNRAQPDAEYIHSQRGKAWCSEVQAAWHHEKQNQIAWRDLRKASSIARCREGQAA